MKQIFFVAMLALGITACSSKPKVDEFSKSANAKEEIFNLKTAINTAVKDDTAILAPESFSKAKDSLSEAQNMEKNDKSKEDVLEEVALGRAYLNRAHNNAEKAKSELRDVLAVREEAISANGDELFPSRFKKFEEKISNQTSKLENDKETQIDKMRSELIAGYSDLELSAIKANNLGDAKNLIDKSVAMGARDLTPTTLNEANKKYEEADMFITKNRHSTDQIEAKSAEAFTAAEKLQATTNTARGITSTSTEQTALRMQAEEERFAATKDALSEEKNANTALTASNSELSKDQKLQAMYEKARSKFNSNEAEVYKQGKNLVIRMRGLDFPTAKATIKGDNFALLKKVDEVIASFDNSKVTVEGHTDSTGGKALNQRLSDERAMAVKQYLEANTANKEVSFESKGYGFDKPIASNKSSEGRAQNRRVDVIITPETI